jgi:hypothetical protein
MGVLTFTTAEVEKVLDGRMNSFRQDIADSSGAQTITSSGTRYKITIDALSRNDVTAPAYITDRWDATNNKMALPTELDSPVYVGDVSFTFTPDTASAGVGVLHLVIDDTVPKTIRSYSFDYKGAESVNILTTWYLGEDAGYDAKKDGVYFEVEFDDSGSINSKGAVIYRT